MQFSYAVWKAFEYMSSDYCLPCEIFTKGMLSNIENTHRKKLIFIFMIQRVLVKPWSVVSFRQKLSKLRNEEELNSSVNTYCYLA